MQSRLLLAAIKNGVRRFVPTDYSLDFTKLPLGTNRNFDMQLTFHEAADRLIAQSQSNIEFTSIF